MRIRILPFLSLLLLAGLVRAADADTDYAAWRAAYRQSPPRGQTNATKVDFEQFWRDKVVELDALTEKFLLDHPQDPRRWEVMLRSIQMARWRIFPDESSRMASEARDLARLRDMMATTELDAGLREQAHRMLVTHTLEAARARLNADGAIDTVSLAAAVDDFAAQHASSRYRRDVEHKWVELLGRVDADAAHARLQRLAAESSNPDLVTYAEDRLHKTGYRGRSLDIKFTAADGREVNLEKMRGKVVLVDFWATWCGPCMAEMPNVKAVYEKYHAHGFEVIGISLDGGGITKGIQSGVKAKADFLAFLDREKMPWPQHYDNLGWKNEFAVKHRIKSIPAVFLVGRDGKVLSTDARGEDLEPQVRRALGL